MVLNSSRLIQKKFSEDFYHLLIDYNVYGYTYEDESEFADDNINKFNCNY